MRSLVQIFALSAALSGCLGAPPFLKKGTGEVNQGSAPVEVATIDEAGGTTGLFSADAGGAQILTAGSSSGVAGSKIAFPPGSLAVDTTITMTEGEPLATNDGVTSVLGLGNGAVASSGAPVAVLSDQKIDATSPFTVALAAPASAGLTQTVTTYAVLFKVYHAFEDKYVLGVIPSAEIKVDAGIVTFQTLYFGVYQVVATTVTVKAVVVETKAPVQTKAQTIATATATGTATATPTATTTATSTGTSTGTGTATDTTTAPSEVRIKEVRIQSSPATYYKGDVVLIDVKFTGIVQTSASTVLSLDLNSGPSRQATFSGQVRSDSLRFTYVVQPRDIVSRLDYLATDSMTKTAASSVVDTAGRTVPLTLPVPGTAGSLGFDSAIRIDPVSTVNAAVTITTIGYAGRAIPAMVFDDANNQVLVWGGTPNNDGTTFGDGFKFKSDGTVQNITSTGALSPRYGSAYVWTGSEMIVWGGGDDNGARYDPDGDSWSPTSPSSPFGGRGWAPGVWTGTEMIIWGGYSGGELNDGYVYNPGAGTWTPMITQSPPFVTHRAHQRAVWDSTGNRMLVFGGHRGSLEAAVNEGIVYTNGGACSGQGECWAPMSTVGQPSPRAGHIVVWTGTQMIVWGGGGGGVNPGIPLEDGGIYDPNTDTWTPIPPTPGIGPRYGASGVWDAIKQRLVVFGGFPATDEENPYNDFIVFDPATMTWSKLDFGAATNALIAGAGGIHSVYGNGSTYFYGGVFQPSDVALDKMYKVTLP